MLSKLLASASAIAIMFPIPAMAEWVPITSSSLGSTQIESSSVVRTGNIVHYLQRDIENVPDEKDIIANDIYVSRDCYSGNWVVNRIVGYNSSAAVVFDITKTSTVLETLPGTSGSAIHEFVCYASDAASRREFINNIFRQRY